MTLIMPLNRQKNKNFLTKKVKKYKNVIKKKKLLDNFRALYVILYKSEEEKESRVSTLTLARVSDYGLYEDNEAHSVFLCG